MIKILNKNKYNEMLELIEDYQITITTDKNKIARLKADNCDYEMKLEDIEIKNGDKITFDDGSISYSNGKDLKEEYVFWKSIVKIERYIEYVGGYHGINNTIKNTGNGLQCESVSCNQGTFYKLKTIYERKLEILDKEEKEYLSNVIRPFRNKVELISKKNSDRNNACFIAIFYKNDVVTLLPYFKIDTMYKGLELDKEYTLEELGL